MFAANFTVNCPYPWPFLFWFAGEESMQVKDASSNKVIRQRAMYFNTIFHYKNKQQGQKTMFKKQIVKKYKFTHRP